MLKPTWLAALALGLSCSAYAQAPSDHDTRLVYGVTAGDLVAVVEALGHEVTSNSDGSASVTGVTPDGLRFSLDGTACGDSETCLGINMAVVYPVPAGLTLTDVNTADLKYAAANIWWQNDYLGVSRYVILDGGMTIENIKVNLRTLLVLAPQMHDLAKGGAAERASPDPLFGDDSADYALDGTCDDARFNDEGNDYAYMRLHVMRDATDCSIAVANDTAVMKFDFGDNSGDYADDGMCDDVRFTGPGRSASATATDMRADAADCIAAYQTGKISFATR